MNNRKEIEPKYIYTAIPAEYVCVYHRILAMLADYGEEMLKDCKANCTDKNSGVIECFNMFNAAVAAKTLGGEENEKKAALIINYVKAKINQIYKGNDNSTSFIFPVDENGVLKAFVSCNDRPRFWVDEDDLYKQDMGLGFKEEYSLDDENNNGGYYIPFDFVCNASYINNRISANINYFYKGEQIEGEELNNITTEYYVDGKFVLDLSSYVIDITDRITISLKVVSYYKGGAKDHTYAIDVVNYIQEQ